MTSLAAELASLVARGSDDAVDDEAGVGNEILFARNTHNILPATYSLRQRTMSHTTNRAAQKLAIHFVLQL